MNVVRQAQSENKDRYYCYRMASQERHKLLRAHGLLSILVPRYLHPLMTCHAKVRSWPGPAYTVFTGYHASRPHSQPPAPSEVS